MSNFQEMTDDELRDLAETFMDRAIENYQNDGEVVAMALIPTEQAVISVPLASAIEEVREQVEEAEGNLSEDTIHNVGKNLFAQKVRGIARKDAQIVMMVMESWYAKLENTSPEHANQKVQELFEEYGSMANWPEGTCASAIVLSLEHRDGRQVTLLTEYDADTGEILDRQEPSFEATGRMTTWFPENRENNEEE